MVARHFETSQPLSVTAAIAGSGRPKASSVPAPLSQKAAQAAAAASRMARPGRGSAQRASRQVDRQQHGGDRDGAAGPRHHPPQSEDFGREAGIAFRQQDRPDRNGRQRGQQVGPEAGWHLLALQRDRARRLEEAVERGDAAERLRRAAGAGPVRVRRLD